MYIHPKEEDSMNRGLAKYLDSVEIGRCPHCGSEKSIQYYEEMKCKNCGSDLERLNMSRIEKEAFISKGIKAHECDECRYIGFYEDDEAKVCRNCGSKVRKVSIIWRESQYESRSARMSYWERKIST